MPTKSFKDGMKQKLSLSFYLFELKSLPHTFLWTARWIVDTTETWPHAARQPIQARWEQGGQTSDRRFGILWEDFHWSAFTSLGADGHLSVTLFDTHKEEATSYMDLLVARVSTALHCHRYNIRLAAGIGQSFGAHCVAVLNITQLVDSTQTFCEEDAIRLHAEVLDTWNSSTCSTQQTLLSPTLTWQMIGEGPDIQAQLAALIHDKGVPDDAKTARAQTILQRLGVPAATKILADRNPWAALKSAASKPGIALRILSDEEKSKYIEKDRSAPASSIEVFADKLVPSQLVLDPKMLKDGNGDPVPQLQFAQVEADQRGLAICTLGEAAAFLRAPKSISPHALGLLMLELEPAAPDIMTQSGAIKMRFPAQYLVTGEQVLIFGALLSIGDISIDRATSGSISKQPVLPTAIIKYICYRDQYPGNWKLFTEAPVREILKMFEPLNYCNGKNGGTACARTHPDVDKTYEAVTLELWGRHFTAATGAKKTPQEADQFSFQVRVPAAVVLILVSNNPISLYCDPRTDDFRIAHPDFCIIWLNRADFTQVEHMSRTCSYALSIARHRNRYGIRVKKADEAKAWAELKPHQHFQEVKIEQIYEVSTCSPWHSEENHGKCHEGMELEVQGSSARTRFTFPHVLASWSPGRTTGQSDAGLPIRRPDQPIREVEVEALKF